VRAAANGIERCAIRSLSERFLNGFPDSCATPSLSLKEPRHRTLTVAHSWGKQVPAGPLYPNPSPRVLAKLFLYHIFIV
jgi:hypothetical protein